MLGTTQPAQFEAIREPGQGGFILGLNLQEYFHSFYMFTPNEGHTKLKKKIFEK